MDYRELEFYRKAREVVKRTNLVIKKWLKTPQADAISRQLFRSATSIGANIAEGHGRYVGLEYLRFLHIAQGSANETDHWLHTALDCSLSNPDELVEIIQLNNEVRRMLAATIRKIQSQQTAKAIHEPLFPYSPNPSEENPATEV